MATLNKDAAEVMQDYPVHACTDITGFGFLGHLAEMVSGSGYGVRIKADSVPLYPEALEYAAMGLVPAGAYRNREFRQKMVDFAPTVNRILQDVLFDPQTSGGLLISVAPERAAGPAECPQSQRHPGRRHRGRSDRRTQGKNSCAMMLRTSGFRYQASSI